MTLAYTIDNPQELARLVAVEFHALQNPESPSISFKEARKVLNISDDTLTRRLAAAGVRSWWENGGKAFARKDLHKLYR